jgi:hypothetical protein
VTTLEALVELAPDPTHGYPIQLAATAGEWRWVVELADTSAGSYVEWFDITDWYVGDRHQFGADQYMGDARARLVVVQLQIDESDLLAPWGLDTTELFGEDVELDAGLLMRAALARVDGGVTVEWLPVWTGRVDTWGDAAYARGQTRVHEVSVVDTIADLANVPTTIVSNGDPWDEVIEGELLPGAEWSFGVDIYGDIGSPGIPQDLDAVAAGARMDQITDPLGLVWRSLRTGRLVVHPAPWDTTMTNRYDNPLLVVYPAGVIFSYSPDFTDVEYITDDGQQPFGVSRTVAGVLNWFVVTSGTNVYAVDDPVSIEKYGVRPFQASWILDNDPVVDDLLAARAFASVQALPLRTTIDHEGFFPALAMLDHLDPVTVEHAAAEGRPTVTVVGTIRNIVEERTFRHKDADGNAALNWQSTVQVDVTSTTTAAALLPGEDLALVSAFTPGFGGPSGAEFSWTNPTQPTVTPTEIQVRILERSLIWQEGDYSGVGADGITMGWLAAATAYTFQVRLVRRVDGVITHVSPIREILFVTPANIGPTPVPDGEDTDVEVGEPPDFDPDECDLEVELQENDGTGWVTVDTFTGAELTDNGDGTWSLTTPIPNSFFDEGSMYRFRSREDCGAGPGPWYVGPEFDPPDDWTDPCVTPPSLSDPPFDDASLLVYVPQICAPDIIREAVSGIQGFPGDALDEIVAGVGDPTQRALLSITDPDWSDTPGGIVAFGECPQVTGATGDKTLICRVMVGDDDQTAVLFECAAMRLTATAVGGGGWRPGVTVYKVGSTISLAGASVLTQGTAYQIAATHDLSSGDIVLYVDGLEDNNVGGTDNVPTINALPIWRAGVPPASWITDCAMFDSVIDFADPPTVTINQAAGQADPTTLSSIEFTAVFSEAVSGFATGDVTLSGTAGGTLVGTVSGSGPTYTVTVTGMTSAGTVIATIGAGVCTAVSSGLPNAASTSTDNTVTWAVFAPATDMTGLEIWLRGSRVTLSGSDINSFTNDGSIGGTFVPAGGTTKATVGTSINGNATASVVGTSLYESVAVGRWLTDDVYDVYVVLKAAAQINKSIFNQHTGAASIGRCVWGSANDGTGAKASVFFNNGSSHSGLSTATPFDNSPHVIRFHSTGAGDHYIQVDGGTDELVITGQAFTPINAQLRLFAITGPVNQLTATFAEILMCDSVQSSGVAAAATDYLMSKYGI